MKKVLVIDDDPDILDAVQMVLQTGKYETSVTTKGEEIYEKINEYRPDLIILDALLSGKDGRILCKNLKSDSTTKNIPIIMISAHPTAKEATKDCGADSFVAKPFTVVELLEEVKKYS